MMDQSHGSPGGPTPAEAGSHDETLDQAPFVADERAQAQQSRVGAAVCLVQGGEPHLSGETFGLLRARLQVASLVLCLAFATFALWSIVAEWMGWLPAGREGVLFGQVFVMTSLGLCTWFLHRACPSSHPRLRLAEFVVFGLPAMFFFVTQFNMMRICAAEDHTLPTPDVPWLMLMFTYALFIPNTWRRAAIVIAAMALAPIGMATTLWLTDQVCSSIIASHWWSMMVMGLTMVVSGTCAVIGVYTINALRTEAFEARQLKQYKLGRLLGSGGMGEVYLAEHQLLKRPCAIKVVRPEKAGDPRTLARFEREVRETAKLSHWNNIDVFDYGRADDGTFFYVMEYLPGLSLNELVQRFGPLPPERVIFLLSQTCEALAEAHSLGLIHRDIKPANIIAAHRGGYYDVAKLLDFGMAKKSGERESLELTREGVITGSPLYMSPEQATGDREPDARSDIYSLGVVAYFLLTGRPPFDDGRVVNVLVAHANREPVPVSALEPTTPADLEAVVMRCLAKNPDDRFGSAEELRDALESCAAAGEWTYESGRQWWLDVGSERVGRSAKSSSAAVS